jgi:hypothetical protein
VKTAFDILSPMTKIQITYKLARDLNDEDLNAISRLGSVYGILQTKVSPTLDSLLIEYDATRFRRTDVHAVLSRHGIPIAEPIPV